MGAQLNNPAGVALDFTGNIYIADTANNVIRKVLVSNNTIQTVAGNAQPDYTGDGGPATVASLNNPEGLALDAAGNIYIADTSNHRIRKVTVATGIITTVAGSSITGGFSGDGGPATKAKLNNPKGVAVDAAGNIYIADSFNNRIRMVHGGDGQYRYNRRQWWLWLCRGWGHRHQREFQISFRRVPGCVRQCLRDR